MVVVCCQKASVPRWDVAVVMYYAWRGCDKVWVELVEFSAAVKTGRLERPKVCREEVPLVKLLLV